MTIQQLIDKLQELPDKSLEVLCYYSPDKDEAVIVDEVAIKLQLPSEVPALVISADHS